MSRQASGSGNGWRSGRKRHGRFPGRDRKGKSGFLFRGDTRGW